MSDKPYGGRVKKKYYHNGTINRMYEEGKQPDGFVLGMLPRTKEKKMLLIGREKRLH